MYMHAGAAATKKLTVGRGKAVESDEDADDCDLAAISDVLTQDIAADGKVVLANATAHRCPLSGPMEGHPSNSLLVQLIDGLFL